MAKILKVLQTVYGTDHWWWVLDETLWSDIEKAVGCFETQTFASTKENILQHCYLRSKLWMVFNMQIVKAHLRNAIWGGKEPALHEIVVSTSRQCMATYRMWWWREMQTVMNICKTLTPWSMGFLGISSA
jgi:hypothetical protein